MTKQEIIETLEKQLQLLSERSLAAPGFSYDVVSSHSKVMLDIASLLLEELTPTKWPPHCVHEDGGRR